MMVRTYPANIMTTSRCSIVTDLQVRVNNLYEVILLVTLVLLHALHGYCIHDYTFYSPIAHSQKKCQWK